MKKMTRILTIIAMMVLSVSAFAQKPFAGNITFESTSPDCKDPNILSQLAEETQEIIVMGNNWRMNLNVGIDLIIISNGNSKTLTTIYDIPAYGKYYNKLTADQLQEMTANIKRDYEYTDETKSVTGYNCKKVIVKSTNLETDEEKTEFLWVTTELGLGDEINFAQYPGLKGYPLITEEKKEFNGEEFTVITTATKITPNKKVKATDFLLPTDAKDFEDAPEDLKNMLRGGGEE